MRLVHLPRQLGHMTLCANSVWLEIAKSGGAPDGWLEPSSRNRQKLVRSLRHRNGEEEGAALAELAFDPNITAQMHNYLFTDG